MFCVSVLLVLRVNSQFGASERNEVAFEAALVASQVESKIDAVAGAIVAYRHYIESYESDTSDYSDLLGFARVSISHLGGIRTLISTDESGTIVVDTRDGSPGVGINVSDRSYYSSTLQTDQDSFVFSEHVTSRVDGESTWVMSRYAQPGGPEGPRILVAASFDRGFFAQLLHQFPGLSSAIVQEEGVVLEGTGVFGDVVGRRLANHQGVTSTMVSASHDLLRFPLQVVVARRETVYLGFLGGEAAVLAAGSVAALLLGALGSVAAVRSSRATRLEALAQQRKHHQKEIGAMAQVLARHDPYTDQHEARVAAVAQLISQRLPVDREFRERLDLATSVHDIGKVQIPIEILAKPSELTTEEYALIKRHADIGASMLEKAGIDPEIANIVRQHHERMNGSGYPDGLKGDEICLESRVLAVADVVEAVASDRPYRAGKSLKVAVDEIADGMGRLYDEEVAKALLDVHASGDLFFLESSGPVDG